VISEIAALFLQIAVIVLAASIGGRLMRLIRQPSAVGEMLAGIVLGPSVLGWVAPGISGVLFSPKGVGSLHQISILGVVLFMFVVGVRSGLEPIRENSRIAVAISSSCIAVPLVAGAMLATQLNPELMGANGGPAAFALFIGVAMSVTAFPVLARILQDQDALTSRVGIVAITAAALGDAGSWILLAGVIAFTADGAHVRSPLLIAAETFVFAVLMASAGRRFIYWFVTRSGTRDTQAMSLCLVVAGTSAAVTDWLGVHPVFGAFLAGAVMPKDVPVISAVVERIEPLVVALALPLFFASTGQQVNVRLLHGSAYWYALIPILAVAVLAKAVPAAVVAKIAGFSTREAIALGGLMNTRGLVEVVILRVGFDEGLLAKEMFAMMIVMTVCTTIMGPPILAWSRASSRSAAARA
jgi:Kef-type K+ transport system membrane component KefB